MKVLYVNADGSGFADYIDVPEGTTIQSLFQLKLPGAKPENYLIRVNRLPAAANQVLCEGDRITVTPTKIEGAA